MLKDYIKLIRIYTWIKNFFVFVPIIFSLNLFNSNLLLKELLAFVAFCFASSLVYVINDISDKESDSRHPYKKNRPIAAGKISIMQAVILSLILLTLTFLFAAALNVKFIVIVLIYILINIFYSIKLKDIVIIDIFCIASGFILRIVGGAFAINVVMSSWLILTTMFLSLFLAALKRRAEMDLQEDIEFHARKVLLNYSKEFIDQISLIAAAGIIICYALYTVSLRTVSMFNTENLIFTTPFVVFGIYRYMYLINVKKRWEDISRIILTDFTTIINIVFYLIFSIIIIYKIV
jgi:decaprenyl-phosphate phosphoribosyltransferase